LTIMAPLLANGRYILHNVASKTVLDLTKGSTNEGTPVMGYTENKGTAQTWDFLKLLGGSYQVTNGLDPDTNLGYAKPDKGQAVVVHKTVTAWKLVPVVGIQDTFCLTTPGGVYLDLSGGGNVAPGTPVVLWDKNDQANQQWTFVSVPTTIKPAGTSPVVFNGRYTLRNVMNKRVLELTTEGKVVCSTQQDGELRQLWDIRTNGDNSYQILNAIDETGRTYFSYDKPDQHTHAVGSKNFKVWFLTPLQGSKGTFFMSTTASNDDGLYVDLAADNASEEGCQALLWPYIGRTNQQWILETDSPVKTDTPFKPILMDTQSGTIRMLVGAEPLNRVHWDVIDDPNIKWEFQQNADGSYNIRITHPNVNGWGSYSTDSEGSYFIWNATGPKPFILRRHATRPTEFHLLTPHRLVVEVGPAETISGYNGKRLFRLTKTIKDSPLQLWKFPAQG